MRIGGVHVKQAPFDAGSMPEPKRPFIIAPKMSLIAALDGSGTANMANWRLSRFGMSFLAATYSTM